MIQYQMFKVTDVKEVNKFLKENTKGIPASGIHYHDGNICFIFTSSDEEVQKKEGLLASINTFLSENRAKLLGFDADERYWRRMAKKAVKGASDNVLSSAGNVEYTKQMIAAAEEIKQEVEDGTWLEEKKK